MPAPAGGKGFKDMMKPKNDAVTDRQLLAETAQTVAASTVKAGVTGDCKQKIETGFEINPLDEKATDKVVFNFDFDAPAGLMPKGSRVV